MVDEQSEHVDISLNKFATLLKQHNEYKEKTTKELSQLYAQVEAYEQKIKFLRDAFEKLRNDKMRRPTKVSSKQVEDFLAQSAKVDRMIKDNKEKLVSDAYNRYYKDDVDEFKAEIEKLMKQ